MTDMPRDFDNWEPDPRPFLLGQTLALLEKNLLKIDGNPTLAATQTALKQRTLHHEVTARYHTLLRGAEENIQKYKQTAYLGWKALAMMEEASQAVAHRQ